jgi:hypothetical protein
VHVADAFPGTFHQVLLRPLLLSLFTPEKSLLPARHVHYEPHRISNDACH